MSEMTEEGGKKGDIDTGRSPTTDAPPVPQPQIVAEPKVDAALEAVLVPDTSVRKNTESTERKPVRANRRNFLLASWMTVLASVISALGTVAAAFIAWIAVEQWNAESEERQLTRELYKLQILENHRKTLMEAADADTHPLARFRVADAMHALAALGEPIILVGRHIVLAKADLSCLSDVVLIADKIEFEDVLIETDASWSLKANEVRFFRTTFRNMYFFIEDTPQHGYARREAFRSVGKIGVMTDVGVAFSNWSDTHVNVLGNITPIDEMPVSLTNSVFVRGSIKAGRGLIQLDSSYADSLYLQTTFKILMRRSGWRLASAALNDVRAKIEGKGYCIVDADTGRVGFADQCPPQRSPVLQGLSLKVGSFPYGAWYTTMSMPQTGFSDLSSTLLSGERLETYDYSALGLGTDTPRRRQCASSSTGSGPQRRMQP